MSKFTPKQAEAMHEALMGVQADCLKIMAGHIVDFRRVLKYVMEALAKADGK